MNDDFSTDFEFRKLLARHSDIDLTAAALEIARDADPMLTFGPTQAWIAARGRELMQAISRTVSERETIVELGNLLGSQHGIRGDDDCYQHAASSFLNQIISRKRGIPIGLSVLFMAVAKEAGVTLHGVAAPAHFLTRFETVSGPLFLDAFAGGRILTEQECLEKLERIPGMSSQNMSSLLKPASARTIIIRMLNNLKVLYLRQANWTECRKVQLRLAALLAGDYGERRDLAVITLRSGRAGQAIQLLKRCLQDAPAEERQMLQEHLAEAQRTILSCN